VATPRTNTTIRDVAQLAKVSTATVSHVLHGRDERMAPKTRERVLSAIRELRYRPTAFDSNVETTSRQLAFVLEEQGQHPTSNSYGTQLLDGVWETCSFAGWSVGLYIEKQWDGAGGLIRRNFDGRCDGIVLIAPSIDSPAPRQFAERGLPLVLLGRERPMLGVCTVDINNEECAAELTRRMIALGHRRIAYVTTSPRQESSVLRATGFARSAIESGIPLNGVRIFQREQVNADRVDQTVREYIGDRFPVETIVHTNEYSGNFAQQVFERFDAQHYLPTAILCFNDDLVNNLNQVAQSRGITDPRQLSWAGFDADPSIKIDGRAITSVWQPLYEMGRAAAQLILERCENPELPNVNLQVSARMVEGETLLPVLNP